MTIHLYGPLTRTISPGDVVDVSGIFLPTPYTGMRAMRAGLLQDTFLEGQFVRQMKKSYNDLEMTDKTREELEILQEDEGIYHKLAQRSVLSSSFLEAQVATHKALIRSSSALFTASPQKSTDTRTSRRLSCSFSSEE
jgi:DNA replicative helicase MCM subunit Mcm2 (Cdc46/Mcm family)